MRILYVEDNPANVFLVKRVAKMGQHEIINFIDGREAIRKYDDVKPDLVLMDIQLVGETSGLEVVKELRGRGVTTPIIAVTAYAMVGDKERCLEAGCNDYLAKPLPIPRLIEIFQQYDSNIRKTTASMLAVTVEKIVDHTPEVAPSEPVPPVATNPSTSPVDATASIASTPAETPAVAAPEVPSATAPVVTPAAASIQTPAIESSDKPAIDSPVATIAEPATGEVAPSSDTTVDSEMEDTLPTKVETKPIIAEEKPKTEPSTTEANG